MELFTGVCYFVFLMNVVLSALISVLFTYMYIVCVLSTGGADGLLLQCVWIGGEWSIGRGMNLLREMILYLNGYSNHPV